MCVKCELLSQLVRVDVKCTVLLQEFYTDEVRQQSDSEFNATGYRSRGLVTRNNERKSKKGIKESQKRGKV